MAASMLAVVMAGAAEPLDPDALATLLADLEASGGILTGADLATLALPAPSTARGSWQLALTGRSARPARADLRAERRARTWSFRLRARRAAAGDLLAGWMRTSVASLTLDLGAGAPVHGGGLIAAPPGRRPSLSPDVSLLAPEAGWRPSTSTEPGATMVGGVVTWEHPRGRVGMGMARDGTGATIVHAQTGVSMGEARIAALVRRRGREHGLGIELRWRRAGWQLAAEAARWRGASVDQPGQAWLVTAGWQSHHWRAEMQAAASRAAAGLEGGARPACLPGWHGRGWAGRVRWRPMATVSAALIYGHGAHRDPRSATGTLSIRSLLGLRVRGPAWEVRLRRSDEVRRRWDPLQPWLPAAPHSRRRRTWLTAAATAPAAGGEGRFTWRWLEESGESRHLLSVIRTARRPWGRWRVGVQLAWGAPLDLVAVSAPVAGLVRLRHWGHWRSGLVFGIDGGTRWRWQAGGETRQSSGAAASQLMVDVHAAWGRSF